MCDPGLLVNKFSFIQVAELGSIKTHTEIGSKHPLVALEENKEKILFQVLISATPVTYFTHDVKSLLKSLYCDKHF